MSDRQKFLSGLDAETAVGFAKLFDRALRAEKSGAAMFCDFLSMEELARLEQRMKYLPDAEPAFFGGYPDAERKMAGFNASEADFPIVPVRVAVRAGLTHRDYLGSVMALGIERRSLGDIIVSPEGAVIMVSETVADYIASNLGSVGRYGVKAELMRPGEFVSAPAHFTDISGTVASMRLDSLTALFVSKGRGAACELIKAGRVYVNGLPAEKADIKIDDGDIITVRGFGKACVETGGRSRKDRIFVTLKKRS